MRRILLAVFTTIIIGMAQPVHSGTSGYELKAYCAEAEEDNYFSAGVCMGYVIGTIDGITSLIDGVNEVEKSPDGNNPLNMPFCLTENSTHGQIVAVVRKYLEANPDKLHFSGASLITEAMWNTFPCYK